MAVRWISQAARELGIGVWDAIALLTKEDEYPMNGLLDEERFQLLKHARKKGVDATGSRGVPAAASPASPPPPPARPASPPPLPPPPAYRNESTAVTGPPNPDAVGTTGVTTPIPTIKDKSEDKTVIYPAGT